MFQNQVIEMAPSAVVRTIDYFKGAHLWPFSGVRKNKELEYTSNS